VGFGHEWANNREHPKTGENPITGYLGPVVAQMQAVFIDNWIKATGRVLHGPEYFRRTFP